MIVSPYYDEIKARAVEMLNDPAGFNGHSQNEMRSWRMRDWWELRNSAGVALCLARDEVETRLGADATAPAMNVRKIVRFNVGNFERAEREIARTFLRTNRNSD
jgi:hypothetical protein